MPSLREQLPNGSNRNKVEALADFIEQQLGQLGQSSGEAAPANLLLNPDFSHSSYDFSQAARLQWLTDAFTYKDQGPEQMHLGRSYGRPAPPAWGVEIQPVGVSDSHSARYLGIGGEVEKGDTPAKGAFFLSGASSSRVLHFSVFTAPFEMESAYTDAAGERKLKNLSFSAYLACSRYSGNRFGVLELNERGDFIRYVASGPIANATEPTGFNHTWLHDIKLKAGGLYAFFVESDTTNSGMLSCAPAAAGVFLNPERANVVPDLTPNPAITQQTRVQHSFGHLTKAQMNAGATLDVSRFALRYGMEKHLIFCACKLEGHADTAPFFAATITRSDYKSVLVQGDTHGSEATAHILALYSPTPVHLNYFASGNYTAV
ncbi:TPA: hypothetical protein I7755_11715 [Vibrio vulnificus]|nr:hypothetical protein [Vibrio vulnificus]HAS8468587.1 hypothetical protein [Vibrio vulnificus]